MHIILKQRNETLTIKTPDNKVFKIVFHNGEAFVPEQIGRFMIEKGFCAQGPETQNPKPEFEATGSGWGNPLPLFHRYVTEVKDQPTEGPKP